jgi:glycosyltransferase involved in cell wall biosynthesis
MWANRLFFARDVRRADTTIAISQGTSDRMLKHFGRGASAIVRPSVGSAFRPQPDTVVKAVCSRYGIKGPYLLALSTWEPRKNFELLVRTFLNLKKEGRLEGYSLVLAGGRGWKDNRLVSLIQGEGNNHLMPLGYVPEEDLPPLYGGAELFVYPSLYEGFGIPVLEALACGTQVVATDVPEIREAGGFEPYYIEPTEEGLREGILRSIGSARDVTPPTYDTWEKGASELARAFCSVSGKCP